MSPHKSAPTGVLNEEVPGSIRGGTNFGKLTFVNLFWSEYARQWPGVNFVALGDSLV